MRLFKFCLFSSQDFEFFKSPEFVGSEYHLLVALPYEATQTEGFEHFQLSVREIPPAQRARTESGGATELGELAQDLLQKLGPDQECKAIFDARSAPTDWSLGEKRSLRIDPQKPPEAVRRARAFAENFLLLKAAERRMLAAEIPWTAAGGAEHRPALSKKSLRRNYDLHHPEVAPVLADLDRKKKLLLHVCCGPDAAGVVEQLKEEFELTCFWYDPNIQPQREYDLRLAAFLKVAALLEVPSIVGEYDASRFLKKISGLEASPEQGAKCTLCYDMRLERAAQEAQAGGFDCFSTTLAISPHKVQLKLKNLGEKIAQQYKIPYLARNFMKHDGFKDSVDFTEAHDIYRQDYCGCWFSLHEGGPAARKLADTLGLGHDNLSRGHYTLPTDEAAT